MYSAYTTPPFFYNDQELSATSLKILRNNIIILDSMAQRGFQAQRIRNINTGVGDDPHPIWRGSFMYRAGCDIATIRLFVTTAIGETLKVNFNGNTVYSAAMVNGQNTASINIFSLGFSEGQIILVDVLADYPSGPQQNSYIMQEAYTSSVENSLDTSWSTMASIGALGSITASDINKLTSNQIYLHDWLTAPELPLQMSSRYVGGWWLPEETPATIASYRFARNGNNNRLKVIIDYQSRQTQSTTLQYIVNNSLADSFTFGPNTKGFIETQIDISALTLDSPSRLDIVEVINTPAPTWRGAVNTKYNIRLVETLNSSGYVAPTLPTETQMLESMTFSTLLSRLNSLRTATETLYDFINDNLVLLDRSYMFARRPLTNDDQEKYLKNSFVARKKRQGDVLVVKGINLRIGWGYETSLDVDKPEYEFSNEESLTSGDNSEVKVIYLDSFDGLEYGFPYFVMGDVIEYAAEFYRLDLNQTSP